MSKRTRLTVFSRFLLWMLLIGPLAYIGASYYNGEDGLKNITNIWQKGKDKLSNTQQNQTQDKANDETYEIKKLKEELNYKQKRLDELYKEKERLERKVKQLEEQLSVQQN